MRRSCAPCIGPLISPTRNTTRRHNSPMVLHPPRRLSPFSMRPNMHGKVNRVLANTPLITERLYQSLASAAVRKVQLGHDMTDAELADNIGCSAATVGNARNMKGELHGRIFANLMRVEPLALEGLLAHFGRRSVPMEARCDTDALPSLTNAVHRLAVAQSHTSPGGPAIHHVELLDMLPALEAAQEAISTLIVQARELAA